MTDPLSPEFVSETTEGQGIRVFVAEDEAIIRLDIVETLSSMGFEVVGQSARGDDAETQIRELVPDVAILDIKMPGRTGIEVARSLTNDLVCAVVILSAFSQRGLVEEAIDAGVLAYLIKPFQRNEISVQIGVARARHQQMKHLADEVDSLHQRLSDRVLLDRAKGVLIDNHGLGEAEAMRFVQKRAMDQRRAVRDVASDILDGSLEP
ncbi:MAG: response regulator [Acidimicrobiaceae bacterium]|nr:response regulator [Acidimicrobiaceae bacterium]MDC1389636.1 response regulator [Acidimicrobiales bacterium]